jgi:hypothetical protein
MSYNIVNTAGTQLATITDGTVDTATTSLTLIGKNYAGYGIFLNENYVKLLENFAHSTPPSGAMVGQLWWDSANNLLKVYNGSIWKPISSSASGASAPVSPITGDLWWDSSNAQLKVWSGSNWVVVGPAFSSSTGQTGAIVATVTDTGSASHVILEMYVANSIVAIYSKDTAFTPSVAIPGFTTINPGMNLASTAAIPGSSYNGAISSASANGMLAAIGGNLTPTTTDAYSIGSNSARFQSVYANAVVASSLSGTLYGNVVGYLSSPEGPNGNVNLGNIMPLANDVYNIGAAGLEFKEIYAGTIYGNVIGTINGSNGAPTSFSGTITVNSDDNLIAIENGGSANVGNIGTASVPFNSVFANMFYGTAITAQYADLAERFAADAAYTPGTVVALGGAAEITAVAEDLSNDVFGVVSSKAAFLMNGLAGDDQSHPAVAVNGRVPVRVVGEVRKGDRLVSAGNGLARAASMDEVTAFNVIGRALQNKYTTTEGLIEAVVKLNS